MFPFTRARFVDFEFLVQLKDIIVHMLHDFSIVERLSYPELYIYSHLEAFHLETKTGKFFLYLVKVVIQKLKLIGCFETIEIVITLSSLL